MHTLAELWAYCVHEVIHLNESQIMWNNNDAPYSFILNESKASNSYYFISINKI